MRLLNRPFRQTVDRKIPNSLRQSPAVDLVQEVRRIGRQSDRRQIPAQRVVTSLEIFGGLRENRSERQPQQCRTDVEPQPFQGKVTKCRPRIVELGRGCVRELRCVENLPQLETHDLRLHHQQAVLERPPDLHISCFWFPDHLIRGFFRSEQLPPPASRHPGSIAEPETPSGVTIPRASRRRPGVESSDTRSPGSPATQAVRFHGHARLQCNPPGASTDAGDPMPRTASIGVAWNELEHTPPGTAADSHQPAATPGNRKDRATPLRPARSASHP